MHSHLAYSHISFYLDEYSTPLKRTSQNGDVRTEPVDENGEEESPEVPPKMDDATEEVEPPKNKKQNGVRWKDSHEIIGNYQNA